MGRDSGMYRMHSGKWKFEDDKLNWFSDCQDKSREEDRETMAGRLRNGEKKLEEQEFQQGLFREYMHCPKAGCTVCPSKGPYAWAACASCSAQCFGKTQGNMYETFFSSPWSSVLTWDGRNGTGIHTISVFFLYCLLVPASWSLGHSGGCFSSGLFV